MEENIQSLSQYYDSIKFKGIGGWMIIFATWTCVAPFLLLSNISLLSQAKLTVATRVHMDLPELYFTVANFGYRALFPFSILLIVALFKKLRIFKYLEILNFILRTALLASFVYILDDLHVVINEFGEILALSVLASLMTIVYFFVSKRAKTTFVNKKWFGQTEKTTS